MIFANIKVEQLIFANIKPISIFANIDVRLRAGFAELLIFANIEIDGLDICKYRRIFANIDRYLQSVIEELLTVDLAAAVAKCKFPPPQ